MSYGTINQLFMFGAEAFAVSLLLLGLFRSRTWLGLAPLYVTIGVFQPIQVILASSVYAEVLPGLVVSPGSVIMFTASLFAILLIYISEDAIEARKVIYGIMAANITMTLLMLMFGFQLGLHNTFNFLDLPVGLFNQGTRVMITGTLTLFADVLLIIFVFEAVSRLMARQIYMRIFLTMAAILIFDSVLFTTGAFYGRPDYSSIMMSGIVGKVVMAAFYSMVTAVYIRFVEPLYGGGRTSDQKPFRDIFYALTYREKYKAEHERAEAAARESEILYKILFDKSPIGLALCRMDGRLVNVNPEYARIIGRSVEEMKESTYWDITPEKYDEKEREQLKSLESKGSYGPYEKEYTHKDGHKVPVRLRGLLVEKKGEKFIWSSVEDISGRIKAEADLRRNSQILRLFVENSPAAIAMFDNDMKYIVASRRFLSDYGLGDQDIIGRSHYEVFPEIPERWREIHRRCLAGAVEKSDQDPFLRKDGRTDWVRWEIHPWYITQGEIGGIILFSEVITERKHAELELTKHRDHLEDMVKERTMNLEEKKYELERSQTAMQYLLEDVNAAKKELEAANVKLKELDQLKSMFIASMSHELRTPLNSIIGFTGMTLQGLSGEMNEEQRDNLQRVYKAAKHLLSLISDVIDISKIEAGRLDVYIEEFPLEGLVREAAAVVRPQLEEKGLSLEINVAKGIIMHTDRKRLLQCLLNFLSNAVKFTEHGSLKIDARYKSQDEGRDLQPATCNLQLNSDFVEISVSDTGIGVAEEDMPRLFQAFERLQSQLRVKAGGTGLGLYLTKKLATELLHGTVSVKSEPGKGSVFSVVIPREI